MPTVNMKKSVIDLTKKVDAEDKTRLTSSSFNISTVNVLVFCYLEFLLYKA